MRTTPPKSPVTPFSGREGVGRAVEGYFGSTTITTLIEKLIHPSVHPSIHAYIYSGAMQRSHFIIELLRSAAGSYLDGVTLVEVTDVFLMDSRECSYQLTGSEQVVHDFHPPTPVPPPYTAAYLATNLEFPTHRPAVLIYSH